jgi:hypothetical protein
VDPRRAVGIHARAEWEDLRFGHLQMHDVRKILLFGRELRKHSRNAVDILNDIKQVVAAGRDTGFGGSP